MGLAYLGLPSRGKLSLKVHLHLVVLEQNERREERHIPILGAVNIERRL